MLLSQSSTVIGLQGSPDVTDFPVQGL
jgi:hypothetical protein